MKKGIINHGDKINRLKFLKELKPTYQSNGNIKRHGLFRCECGIEKRIRIDSVKSGHVKSCGCYGKYIWKKVTTDRNTTHGLSKHDLYKRWLKIKSRCLKKNDKRYKDYGGRGITVCKEWTNSFISFYDLAITNGYEPNLAIDRKNNNGNYEPSNCRFVTDTVNSNNTRRNIIVMYNAQSMTLMQACDMVGLRNKYRSIWQSIKAGKSFNESIKTYSI